jgi:predicted Zn-dependent protease
MDCPQAIRIPHTLIRMLGVAEFLRKGYIGSMCDNRDISMQRRFPAVRHSIVIVLVSSFLALSCSSVPITGRSQLSLVSDSEMMSMSYQEYDKFLKENKLSTDKQATEMVRRVGLKIQKGVETYFATKEMSQQLEGYKWEFNLVESKDVNAWCMPGGKVVVYTGILPVTKTEAGLAVVMGHEIAHAVARHGAERMSQEMLAQMGAVALDAALAKKSAQTKSIWMSAYGIGAQYGALLPYSRTHESEADQLGLYFMAMAGYDPHEAVSFWERMAQTGGGSPPEFMSTHPAHETRIDDLKKLLPEAMTYYQGGK